MTLFILGFITAIVSLPILNKLIHKILDTIEPMLD